MFADSKSKVTLGEIGLLKKVRDEPRRSQRNSPREVETIERGDSRMKQVTTYFIPFQ